MARNQPLDAIITIDGVRELNRQFRRLGDAAVRDLKSTHADAARDVEREASALVPRRSGRLDASLRSSGTMKGGIVRAGSARVPYAGPIHFGWARRNIRPQPFLYDALDSRREEVREKYEDGIRSLIRKYNLD